VNKAAKTILFAIVYIYLGMAALLYFQQRSLMYFPGGERENIATFKITQPEIISVQSTPDISFNAWYWPADIGMPTLVFFHGNGQAYQYWVNKLMIYHNQGYGVFFTDYRGYGGAKGNPGEQGIYTDARAHINSLLKSTNLTTNDLIYHGESLGTGVATQMAIEFPPKAIIYESAYSATNDIGKSRYWMFPIDLLMKDKYRSADKIKTLTMPKLFVHGTKDKVIPIRFGRALYDAAPEPKKWIEIENAGHNDLYDNGAQLHISKFLSTLINQ